MATKRFLSAIVLVFVCSFPACIIEPDPGEMPVSQTVGYRPVYASASEAGISVRDPRSVNNPGKIYRYGNYLLVNEAGEGIHVFGNEDPSSPEPLAFIRIPGNTEMAIKDDVLYANHLGNIVALDFSDLNAIEQVGSLPLQSSSNGILPPKGFYFECIDPSKGIVLNWVMTDKNNMDCYALR